MILAINTPNNFKVIITRPERQAVSWAAQLTALGFEAVQIPVLAIQALTDEAEQNAIRSKIINLDNYQKIIFVSQNAVIFGMEWIQNFWPQMPVGVEYFAIGATTAKLLESYSLRVSDLAVSEAGEMTSEALLRAPQLQQINGKKILILRGRNGRGHLAEELRSRGAQVDYCEVYERFMPKTVLPQLQHLMTGADEQQTLILTVHSGESLENLVSLISRLSIQDRVKNCVILVPSQRIAETASEVGFLQVICAKNATDQAMTDALLTFCSTQH